MKHSDFKIGDKFMCGHNEWLVTDIGARTVVAIRVKEGWMEGPDEVVFDETDLPGCKRVLPYGADFICEDCASVVFSIGADPTPDVHLCYVCRYIRTMPDMPDELKRTLRGIA